MEVHHHSHTPRRKWTHYFWEFLMLFMAVFCGFLAEMKLEHTIEHQREKKYAVSLCEDLRKDSIDLSSDLRWWNMQIRNADTILSELELPSEKRDPLRLYRNLSVMRRYNGFEYHDRTIDQLKNAGFFRLFRKQNVANSLMEYDALVRRTLLNIEEGARTLYFNSNLLMNKFTDTRYFPTLVTFYKLDSLYIKQPEVFRLKNNEDEIFEYANHLRYYRGNMVLRNAVMQNLLAHARELIRLVKDEYHLKD